MPKQKRNINTIQAAKWELAKLPISCFVDSLNALTPEFGCKDSKNYTNKVTIKNTRRYLCSSWIEGSKCIGKGESPITSRSWDYLISFLKNTKADRFQFMETKTTSGSINLNNKEKVLIPFLEVHGANDAGRVADKVKWLNKEIIDRYIETSNLKENYKIFWLRSGGGYFGPDGERKIRDAQKKYGLKILKTKTLDLDKEF